MTYECPVCGYDRMTKPAQNYHICPSCGTEFEADDFITERPALRAQWIAKGMPWFSRSTVKPKDWSPYHQLIIAGFGSDLTDSPRFDTDLEFRYSVNRAFSEVHISKQLKTLREDETLTQSQLAERADMRQSRISALEGMDYSSWSINTLERLARALGVGFEYSFVGWEEVVAGIEKGFSPAALRVRSFEKKTILRSTSVNVAAERVDKILSGTRRQTPVVRYMSEHMKGRSQEESESYETLVGSTGQNRRAARP